jgi:cytochrome c-type biogenesis protein CcmF
VVLPDARDHLRDDVGVRELGWGGYWFWDPVENASLLPWLTGTAFLHSVMIQEKRGMLKMWNVLPDPGHLPPDHLRDLPDALGADRVGAFLRAEPADRVHLPRLHVRWWWSARCWSGGAASSSADSKLESLLSRESAFLATTCSSSRRCSR